MFVSIDDGAHWSRLEANLPTVAVHDLTIHPRENDLVIATYGRALWSGDITPLQELSGEVLTKPAYLFDVEPKARYGFSTQGMNYHLFGDKYLEVPNEPEALAINYYLNADAASGARITVKDSSGQVARQMDGPAKRGLNRAIVNLAGTGGRGAGAGGGQGQRGRGAAPAPPLGIGDYTVTLEVAGATVTKPARIRPRITGGAPPL